VNVISQAFHTVFLVQYERFIPLTIPDRQPFLTVHRFGAFLTISGRSRSVLTVSRAFMSVIDSFMTLFCDKGRFFYLLKFIITGRKCITDFLNFDQER
jgi:hypothetical protein